MKSTCNLPGRKIYLSRTNRSHFFQSLDRFLINCSLCMSFVCGCHVLIFMNFGGIPSPKKVRCSEKLQVFYTVNAPTLVSLTPLEQNYNYTPHDKKFPMPYSVNNMKLPILQSWVTLENYVNYVSLYVSDSPPKNSLILEVKCTCHKHVKYLTQGWSKSVAEF